MELIVLGTSTAPLLLMGVYLFMWGRAEKKRAEERLKWVEELRSRHPWLRISDE